MLREYTCSKCDCKVVKKDTINFDKTIHYKLICPFCGSNMWISKAKEDKKVINGKKAL